MLRDITLPAVFAGLLAAIVGFASSFAIVVKGLLAAGATPEQAASGLMALSLAMGLGGVILSLTTRAPVAVAWSTPGAALLASGAAPEGGFAVAVGAFLVCAVLMLVAASWKPLERLVTSIPAAIANAMLAGVLMGLCLAPARAMSISPGPAAIVIAVWLAVFFFRRAYAVPAAALAAIVIIVMRLEPGALAGAPLLSMPVPVMPIFSGPAIIGIAVPLFLVTMASQNLPGMAVLLANGYAPPAGHLIQTTSVLSLAAAPLGGHAVNLSAITAALCAGPEAGPDPKRRYWAAATNGVAYMAFGLFAGGVIALVRAAPPLLVETVAGLALIGSFAAAIAAAMADAEQREAAAVTFLVTMSGLSVGGIGSAFWGLLAGLAMLGAARLAKALRAR